MPTNIKVTPAVDLTELTTAFSVRYREVTYSGSAPTYGAWSTPVIFPVTSIFYIIRGLTTNKYYQVGLTSICNSDSSSEVMQIFSTYATCSALTTSITDLASSSFTVNVTGLAPGDTWQISLDNGATFPYTGLTLNTQSITGLTPSTLYNVVVKHNCAAGGSTNSANVPTTTTANLYSLTLIGSCTGATGSSYTLSGHAGDTVRLRLAASGSVTWDGVANGAGIGISIDDGLGGIGDVASDASTHSYSMFATSVTASCFIIFVMPSSSVTINVILAVNNSSAGLSPVGGNLIIDSVNGVYNGTTIGVCKGLSSGSW